ncbi:MAG: C10 family peptidase [Bacteroidales bacterium]|nr:C10 family peptidase [Bacteroidales bacterium]
MKKITLLSLFILAFLSYLFAEHVPVSKAKQVAENFYNYASDYRSKGKVIENFEVYNNDILVYYIFNFSTGGYAIISADDEVTPVLSYAFKGKFIIDDAKMPKNYEYFLNSYKIQIAQVINLNLKGDDVLKQKWSNYYNNVFSASKETQDVSPLLDIEEIKWDQGCYYNADCPTDAGGDCGHVYTGCVATAMAQIMRFHKWPEHGTGSYSYNDTNYGTQSANFGTSSYNWDAMPGSVNSSNSEVAKIMYHCGVSVDMMYSTTGSGAYVYGYVKEALVNYFNYDSDAMYAYRENYSDTNWKNEIISDLSNGWPVFYSGTDAEGTSGHAFVCDGYQAGAESFHFNWGWSGYYNSYNVIDELIPGGTGAGGGNGDFSYNHQAVFSVHPTYGLTAVFSAAPTTIYEGNSVSFVDGSFGDPISWSYNFGDGGNATTPNPIHYYNTSGIYDVSLTVGDGSSTNTATKTNYIKVVPTEAGFSMDFESCTDYSNNFFPWSAIDADQTNTFGSSDCDFPGESGLMSFMAFNPSDAGFTLASAHGGQRVGMAICPGDNSASDDWLISERLQLGTNSSISLWALSPKPGSWGNNTYQVLVSTTNNNPSSFTLVSGANPIEAPDTWTQHTYNLSSYDGQNVYIAIHHVASGKFMLWIDDIEIITTSGAVALNADFYANATSLTLGQTVNFTDNSIGNPTNWNWNFGDGGTSQMQNPSYTYNSEGIYTVELTISDGTNSDTETKTAYINVSEASLGNWIEQASGFSTASRGINHISIVNENIVWATAYDGSSNGANIQEFTKTTNGGATWTAGNLNLGNTGLGISMITAIDANTAWLAAYPTGTGQTGGIWKTTNGGSNWTRQNTATYNNASSFTNVVYFWDENNGFCQGDPINEEFELYTTTNGGTTWTAVSAANIPNPQTSEYGYVRKYEVIGNHIWFGTNKGRLYHSSNKGISFEVFNTPVSDFAGASASANFSFKDANNGLIVNQSGTVYKTTNGGASWTQLTTSGTVFTNGLCWIEGTDVVFSTGAATDASGSSYSQDGGLSWTTIDEVQHLYVDFINPNTGWSGWFNTDATTSGMWKWNGTITEINEGIANSVETLMLYPNPVSDNLTIKTINELYKADLKIVNISGQVVFETNINASEGEIININTTNLQKGLYVLIINTDDNCLTKKFIKN